MSGIDSNYESDLTLITEIVFENDPVALDNFDTGVDLTDATAVAWNYKKPSGATGTFTTAGTIDDPPTDKTVSGEILQNELDEAEGDEIPWIIWPVVTFTGPKTYTGQAFKLPVHKAGTK